MICTVVHTVTHRLIQVNTRWIFLQSKIIINTALSNLCFNLSNYRRKPQSSEAHLPNQAKIKAKAGLYQEDREDSKNSSKRNKAPHPIPPNGSVGNRKGSSKINLIVGNHQRDGDAHQDIHQSGYAQGCQDGPREIPLGILCLFITNQIEKSDQDKELYI